MRNLAKLTMIAFLIGLPLIQVQAQEPDAPKKKIDSVAVLGAGTMGGGISMNFLNVGIPVTLIEANQEAGDHFTPREVIKLIVSLMFTGEEQIYTPGKRIKIYDPAHERLHSTEFRNRHKIVTVCLNPTRPGAAESVQ